MRGAVLCWAAFGVAIALPQLVQAKEIANVTPLVTAPAALQPDWAYILARISHIKVGIFTIQHVLLRVPNAQEMVAYRAARDAAYSKVRKASSSPDTPRNRNDNGPIAFAYDGKPNVFAIDSGKFIEDGELRTVLIQVPPGKYILYGIAHSGKGFMTCNCLGTVSFLARPGVVTDIGSLYADKVLSQSDFPQLESNLGAAMREYSFYFGEALVPVKATDPVPASLSKLAIQPAQIEVVGEYYEPGAVTINRLAPIPGILDYVRGHPHNPQEDH